MRRKQPVSFGTKISQATLPLRQGIGRGITRWQRMSGTHKIALLLLLPGWLYLFSWQPAPSTPPAPVSGKLSLSLATQDKKELPIPTGGKRIDHLLAQGETLAALFRQWKLPSSELIALIRAEPYYKPLSKLGVGHSITAILNAEGQLHYLEVTDNGLMIIAFRRMGQEFSPVTTP